MPTSSKRTSTKTFKRGDRVAWNSEAGRVTGIVRKKVTSEIVFKGYRRHASKTEPQYIIESDKTDHVAIHKGSALKKIAKKTAQNHTARKSGKSRRKD
jgi:hydrogenase maturation factor